MIVVTTTSTTYAPLSDYQVLDFLHSTRSLELPVLAVHESLCTVSGVSSAVHALYTHCTLVACEDLFILGQNITLHCQHTTIATITTTHQHHQATVSR